MKLFLAITLCLCTLSAHAQIRKPSNAGQETNGSYSFSRATISGYNSDTKAEVFSQVFADTASLKGIRELPAPPAPVFLSAHIQGGRLAGCTLWNNNKDYNVTDGGMLLEPAKEADPDAREDDIFPEPYRLSPLYTLEIEGRNAIFTFTQSYGCSLYDFTVEAKLIIVMVRDEPNK